MEICSLAFELKQATRSYVPRYTRISGEIIQKQGSTIFLNFLGWGAAAFGMSAVN
jgi:hypothetical protein